MTIAYTRPRQIVASDVRQGDQVATFAGTGDFAGIRAAERDDPDLIVWVEVDRFDHGFGDTPEGVVLVDGAVGRSARCCTWWSAKPCRSRTAERPAPLRYDPAA